MLPEKENQNRTNGLVLFFSLEDSTYSRTGTYFSSKQAKIRGCQFIKVTNKNKIRQILEVRRKFREYKTTIVVASPSQILVPYLALIFFKRPNLDAGWSLYESSRIHSSNSKLKSKQIIKSYLVDFIASHCSKLIFVESSRQKNWYKKIFLVSGKKIHVIYTGVNENEYTINVQKKQTDKKSPLKVLFRGKYNPESGLEMLAKVTRVLENENFEFRVISAGFKNTLKFSTKTTVISDYLPSKKLIAAYYLSSDLALGQLSANSRLDRTIPHKAFESAYLGVPYLSSRMQGVLELFSDDEIFYFDPGSCEDLIAKLRFIEQNRTELAIKSQKFRLKYQGELSQEKLASDFFENLS